MKDTTLENYKDDQLYPRIVSAAEQILEREKYVSPAQLFIEMGYLTQADYQAWKNGAVPYLEKAISCNLGKCSRVLKVWRFHAHDLNLKPSISIYKYEKRLLRFSKTGDPNIEKAYSRHFLK